LVKLRPFFAQFYMQMQKHFDICLISSKEKLSFNKKLRSIIDPGNQIFKKIILLGEDEIRVDSSILLISHLSETYIPGVKTMKVKEFIGDIEDKEIPMIC